MGNKQNTKLISTYDKYPQRANSMANIITKCDNSNHTTPFIVKRKSIDKLFDNIKLNEKKTTVKFSSSDHLKRLDDGKLRRKNNKLLTIQIQRTKNEQNIQNQIFSNIFPKPLKIKLKKVKSSCSLIKDINIISPLKASNNLINKLQSKTPNLNNSILKDENVLFKISENESNLNSLELFKLNKESDCEDRNLDDLTEILYCTSDNSNDLNSKDNKSKILNKYKKERLANIQETSEEHIRCSLMSFKNNNEEIKCSKNLCLESEEMLNINSLILNEYSNTNKLKSRQSLKIISKNLKDLEVEELSDIQISSSILKNSSRLTKDIYFKETSCESPFSLQRNIDLEDSLSYDDSLNSSVSECNIKSIQKTIEQTRNSYYAKLVCYNVWIPTKKEKNHNSLTIFDWDDTLFFTSFISNIESFNKNKIKGKESQSVLSQQIKEKIMLLDTIVEDLLTKAILHGDTYIITNAEEGWVEYTAKKYLPKVAKILDKYSNLNLNNNILNFEKEKESLNYSINKRKLSLQNNNSLNLFHQQHMLTVISARAEYQELFPGNMRQWKIMTFLDLLPSFEIKAVTNFICCGDSMAEIDAAQVLASKFKNVYIKTIKFKEVPKLEDLILQVELLNSRFESIFKEIKNMNVKFTKNSKGVMNLEE